MGLVARMDDLGKAGWLGLLVLSFFVFWPAALALLAFLIWSGRMGCWGNSDRFQEKMDRMQAKMDRMREHAGRWGGWEPRSSGNRAFDEYRAETLRRLEEEQKEFKDFLERLRHARDKAEFDQFMADRKTRRDEGPAAQPS
jgi:hypothetical protein